MSGYAAKKTLRRIGLMAVMMVMMCARPSFADLYLNVVAVNGTDEEKKKEIKAVLPPELTADDVIDTDGLRLEYDVDSSSYMVLGEITLGPKETKTFKVLIRDLWRFEDAEVNKIFEQMDTSLDQLEGSEYHEAGKIKLQALKQRMEFLLAEQARHADDVEKRIDTFRVYTQEFDDIKEKSASIKFWRDKPPVVDESEIFYFIIELENPADQTVVNDQRNYLPQEVKPEHFVDLQDFDIRYDAVKERSYLIKEEELQPKEIKQYSIGIIDTWNINQTDIDNLWTRGRLAYKFIEPTKYVDNANFLMEDIKLNLTAIEESQAREKNINEHISVYRKNVKRLEAATKGVEALEELLEIIREELKRSKLENILKKIRGLRTLVDIAKSILQKPADEVAWRIIVVVLGFVGLLTIINFAIWGSRSKNMMDNEPPDKEDKEKGSK